ncbi:MAG: hypothetical protein HYT37_00595 [Candidatus Sungbacteria bacterium]|nr:hypothetical protein [Candidatus Sungbacteria bacterium]
MNQQFVWSSPYDEYIVSFSEMLTEEEARVIMETCGVTLANFMKKLSMAVAYVPRKTSAEVLNKLANHQKTKTIHSNKS